MPDFGDYHRDVRFDFGVAFELAALLEDIATKVESYGILLPMYLLGMVL